MSVEKAKEAVQCDVKDGTSWCKWIINCNVFDVCSDTLLASYTIIIF